MLSPLLERTLWQWKSFCVVWIPCNSWNFFQSPCFYRLFLRKPAISVKKTSKSHCWDAYEDRKPKLINEEHKLLVFISVQRMNDGYKLNADLGRNRFVIWKHDLSCSKNKQEAILWLFRKYFVRFWLKTKTFSPSFSELSWLSIDN